MIAMRPMPSPVRQRSLKQSVARLSVAAGVLVFLLSACGQTGGCTSIGATGGISFDYRSVLARHPGIALTVTACVRADCIQLKVGTRHRQYAVLAGHSTVTDAAPVPVSLTIVNQQQHVVFQGSTTVLARKMQPNGPQCPPTAWFGQVITGRGNDLHQTHDL